MAEATTARVHLTPQRETLLRFIVAWHAEHGYSPTVRELNELMGLASISTIHGHLEILRDEGCVTWVPGQNRTLVVTERGRNAVRPVL
jgi:repressor LexA